MKGIVSLVSKITLVLLLVFASGVWDRSQPQTCGKDHAY
jgi:hypothetical protein